MDANIGTAHIVTTRRPDFWSMLAACSAMPSVSITRAWNLSL